MSKLDFYTFKDGAYDFYRCYSCHNIFTYQQERARMAKINAEAGARICPCGSRKYQPSFPIRSEWLKPNVLGYTIKLTLARGLAPKLPKFLLPLLEVFL